LQSWSQLRNIDLATLVFYCTKLQVKFSELPNWTSTTKQMAWDFLRANS
jgi:hypothetical protein